MKGKIYKRYRRRKYKGRVRKRKTLPKSITQGNFYQTSRVCIKDTIVVQPQGSPGTSVGVAYTFKLSDLPSYSEYQALFDFYTIKCVSLKLIPVSVQQMVTTNDWSGTNNFYCPMVYACIDLNDDTTPVSEVELLEKDGVRYFPMTAGRSFKIYPKVQTLVFQSGVSSAYGQSTDKWMDTDYPSILYYGFKIYVKADGNYANVFTYRVLCKYYLQFKDKK